MTAFPEGWHTTVSLVALARTSHLHLFTCATLCEFGFAACHDILVQLLAQILKAHTQQHLVVMTPGVVPLLPL